jgi:hypothetical protein
MGACCLNLFIFHPLILAREMMEWSTIALIGRNMGIDFAWGETNFAIVITQYRNRKVEVFYAESFEKPQMNYIIDHIMRKKHGHHTGDSYEAVSSKNLENTKVIFNRTIISIERCTQLSSIIRHIYI